MILFVDSCDSQDAILGKSNVMQAGLRWKLELLTWNFLFTITQNCQFLFRSIKLLCFYWNFTFFTRATRKFPLSARRRPTPRSESILMFLFGIARWWRSVRADHELKSLTTWALCVSSDVSWRCIGSCCRCAYGSIGEWDDSAWASWQASAWFWRFCEMTWCLWNGMREIRAVKFV